MLSLKKAKGILWALGLISILFFAYSVAKVFCADYASADHPLEPYFAAIFYTFYVLGMCLCVAFLMGSTTYVACSGRKSRSGMVLAFGLIASSLSAVVFGWLLGIGMTVTGTYSFAFSGWIEDTQIVNVLPTASCFLLIYLTAWFLFKPLVKKFVSRKRQQLDTMKKRQGYRRYLQAWGLFGSIFTLAILPLSLLYFKSCFGLPPRTQTWYISAWLHGVSIVIAGSELLIGIDLVLDRSKEKFSVGALLLGNSCVGFFTIWFCYILIAAKVFAYYNVYSGSVLFVIIHRIISVILLLPTLLLSRRKGK